MEVEEQEVDVERAQTLQRFGAVSCPADGMAGRLKDVTHELEIERVVLGDQDRSHVAQYSDGPIL
jgi:hypothetical protein